MRLWVSLLMLFLIILPTRAVAWDYSKQSIDVEQILSGGPPKDGIPALLDPQFPSGRKA